MKVFLLRHGETNYNVLGIGNENPLKLVYLNKNGIKQTEQVAERLRNEKISVIIVSEFPRTKQTAEIINKYHRAIIHVDSRLNEVMAGFEGKSPKPYEDAVRKGKFELSHRGWESFAEEKARVIEFLKDLKKTNFNTVLVVSHGDPIRIMRGYFENLSDEQVAKITVNNCELFSYEI